MARGSEHRAHGLGDPALAAEYRRLGQLDLGTLLRLLNTPAVATHAAHAAPVHAGAVRTSSGAPVDLSQFTFLSGGQVLV